MAAGRFGALGLAYVAIAWATIEFIQKREFLSVFESLTPVHYQFILGAGAGAAFAMLQRVLLFKWRRWQTMHAAAARANAGMFRSPAVIILISLIVGVSEEVLFRAAIQPITGIFIASVLFTAVHLNFGGSGEGEAGDAGMAAVSVIMVFAASLLMAFLFDSFGLFASIAGHTIYDAVVLFSYRKLLASGPPAETA